MKWKVINFLETTKHKAWVAFYILQACLALLHRAIVHDLSKYGRQEAPYFEKALPDLRGLEYGSEGYKAALRQIKPAVDHHYQANSHHPEHYQGGVGSMSPLDLVEMLCDWRAATRRHATGDMTKSIRINADRFNYSDQTQAAFYRDAMEIGLVSVEDVFFLKFDQHFDDLES